MKTVLNKTTDGMSRAIKSENLRGGVSSLVRTDGFVMPGVMEIERENDNSQDKERARPDHHQRSGYDQCGELDRGEPLS